MATKQKTQPGGERDAQLAGHEASSVGGETVRLTGPLDPRGSWSADACSIGRALEVVGTRSAMLLLREAFYGTTRFDDFADRVGISEPSAAARLRELVAEGLLEREPYQEPGQRTRLQYRLTEKGSELFPALVALMQWGDRWLAPAGSPVTLSHRDCGQPVRAELRCASGHQPGVGDLELSTGPGARGGSRRAR
jgi:DNA-binding HxlR family transcriptional regulator